MKRGDGFGGKTVKEFTQPPVDFPGFLNPLVVIGERRVLNSIQKQVG